MSTSESVAARLDRVSKRYRSVTGDVAALVDVTAAFAKGAVSVVAGPSGSGKSTLLRLLAGLDHPDAGRLEVAGTRIHPARARVARRIRRRTVGYVFQRPSDNFFPHLTVLEHLQMAANTPHRAGAEALAERLGIGHRLGHRPAQLSGGEQQRAAMAQVLVAGSTIVLADEPTASLDTPSSERLMEVVRPFAEEGVAFIVASHDPLVRAAADDLLELEHGRVADRGRGTVDATSAPSEPATRSPSGRRRVPPGRKPAGGPGGPTQGSGVREGSPGLRWSERHGARPLDVPASEPAPMRQGGRGGEQVVVVEDVAKSYRRGEETVHAVRGASFEAREGEFIALFGRSGSGKTTLLNLIAGWERPDGGRVSGSSGAVRSWSQVAVLPQKLGLFDELTIRGNIEYPVRLAGVLDERRTEVDAMVEALGLSSVQDRHPRETSVGEQQRCALARALVLSPRLILADEPTGHQDHDSGRAVFRALERATTAGATCIAATHNEEILPYIDRLFSMSDGVLEEREP